MHQVGPWPVLVPPAPPGTLPLASAPTMSICIASYQAAATLAAAVDSALRQTVAALEVVVVDDGSTDSTPEVLGRYARDPRVHVLRQANAGEAAAKNAAADAARGDFVVLLDADDSYLPQRMESLTALATARPDLDLLTTDAWIVYDGQPVRRAYHPGWPFEVERQRAAVLVRNTVFGHAAVRRSVWQALGGFAVDVPRAADWDLWQRLVLAGGAIGLVDVPLSHYAVAATTMSADRLLMLEARGRVLRKALRRGDLSAAERAAVTAELRRQDREAALTRVKSAAGTGSRPAARRLSAQTAWREPALGWRDRLLVAGTALAPGLVARRLADRDDGTVAVAGGVRVPRPTADAQTTPD